MTVATGAVREISAGGAGQYTPRVSPNGATLLYLEKCCANSLGGLSGNLSVVRAVPLNVNAVFQGGIGANIVLDAGNEPLAANDNDYGVTPAVN
jgi:hypothetical protein